LVGRER